ncbi:MAG: hypothetical protein OXG03_01770 [Gammaproteobacteria bacterium]|nr:hypothetical protein [Gammaproteobacteria bacterium]
MPKTAETAFNFELAKVLRKKHPRWSDRIGVEQTNVFSEAAGLRPDIVVNHPGGLPVGIETEYTPAATVEQDACQRLGKTLKETGQRIEQAIAVRIPHALASANQNDLGKEIEKAELQFCVFSGYPENPNRWPKSGWLEGGVDDLASCIEWVALSENQIARGMGILEEGIEQAANRLREACADAPDTLKSISHELHQKDGEQTSRMAMAILANALTFHITITGSHEIETLDQLCNVNGKISKTRIIRVWWRILREINYWPIFRIASDVLAPIRNNTASEILSLLSIVADNLVSLGANSQHDLCGRMFQRLIMDRKFLATFYTLPTSATLLAEIAVARLDVDWSDKSAVADLKISDFACGTGALLNSAYKAVLSRYRRKGKDDRDIHPQMMESSLVGADIMPAATHLTASMLSSTHPSVTFRNTSIVTLPYGKQPKSSGRQVAIGALDLIEDEQALSLFGSGHGTGQKRVRGVDSSDQGHVAMLHNGFDIVIMNPPFTRPTNHEKTDVPIPSFAGFDTAKDEQRLMSNRLKQMRTPMTVGDGNAGLASNFIDLAHAKVRPGGIVALVLPAAFLQGSAWAPARSLFSQYYENVVIVSIAAVGTDERAFSADTGMAEVLVVATKRYTKNESGTVALFVNLLQRPQTILEAAMIARSIQQVPDDPAFAPITLGNEVDACGCHIKSTLNETGCAGLREVGVAQAAIGLTQSELRLPRQPDAVQLPLTALQKLGDRGLLDRDINGKEITDKGPRGPFDIKKRDKDFETYPALWKHEATQEKRMIVIPEHAGVVRPKCNGRADAVWEKTASCLHFNRDFQINSQPLTACMTPEPSIGGRAWPSFLCSDLNWEKPLMLWANTTLGLIAFWWVGTRQQQGRATLTISRLPTLTVLDPRKLTEGQLSHAGEIFDQFHDQALRPANEAYQDEVRQALDHAVLIDLLGLPEDVLEPLSLLRRQWCAEPSVHGGKSTAPSE